MRYPLPRGVLKPAYVVEMLTQDSHNDRRIYPRIVVNDDMTELAHANHGEEGCRDTDPAPSRVSRAAVQYLWEAESSVSLPESLPFSS